MKAFKEANPFLGNPLGQEFGSGSTTGWNCGGGRQMAATSQDLVLDFSVRDFVMRSPTFNVPGADDRDLDNNVQVQLGFNMLFGGARTLITHNFTVAPAIEASTQSLVSGRICDIACRSVRQHRGK
jgi:hypothetical protein